MQDTRLKYLFNQCFQNQATPEEQEEFQAFVADSANKSEVEQAMENYWNDFEPKDKPFSITERDMMLSNIMTGKPTRSLKLWPRIVIAAAVAAIVVAAGMYFYNTSRYLEGSKATRDLLVQDIAPGKYIATLSVDGRSVPLSDAKTGVIIDYNKLTYNDGTAVGSLAPLARDGEAREGRAKTLTVVTPRGGTYQVRLPDGTNVWLNAATRLTYIIPLKERGSVRKVELSGEAYFEVFKNKFQPFIIKTASQEIKVLGTHFNVNSYTDEDAVKTTLLEGAINIRTAMDQKILKPGEQSIVRANKVNVVKADLESAVAWKNGEFVFTGQPITEIMRVLARWYNVEVEYKGAVTSELFEGSAMKEKNITEVLQLLELTNTVHFRIEGRKIIVTK